MYSIFRKILFRLSPETAHKLAIGIGKILDRSVFFRRLFLKKVNPNSSYSTKVAGLNFPNPIGLAAGFDKNAEIPHVLADLGFGFIEFGTLTPKPQAGNPKPRLFRNPQTHAIFNRMGFNNIGMDCVRKNLQAIDKERFGLAPIGINLGKNKDTAEEKSLEDYILLAENLKDLGDYFVLNISSPNTLGLRNLQNEKFLGDVYRALQPILQKALFVKLAPDLSNEDFAHLVTKIEEIGYDGLVLCNTSVDKTYAPWTEDLGAGGISGRALRLRSRELLLLARQNTKLPIISVGGVDSIDEIQWRLENGAQLVQVYSEFVFSGPFWIEKLLKDLVGIKIR